MTNFFVKKSPVSNQFFILNNNGTFSVGSDNPPTVAPLNLTYDLWEYSNPVVPNDTEIFITLSDQTTVDSLTSIPVNFAYTTEYGYDKTLYVKLGYPPGTDPNALGFDTTPASTGKFNNYIVSGTILDYPGVASVRGYPLKIIPAISGKYTGSWRNATISFKINNKEYSSENVSIFSGQIRTKGYSSYMPFSFKPSLKFRPADRTLTSPQIRQWSGIESFTFNNMYTSPSEVLQQRFFKFLNLPSPRCMYSTVYIKDDTKKIRSISADSNGNYTIFNIGSTNSSGPHYLRNDRQIKLNVSGINSSTPYYIINATNNNFQLSDTMYGQPVAFNNIAQQNPFPTGTYFINFGLYNNLEDFQTLARIREVGNDIKSIYEIDPIVSSGDYKTYGKPTELNGNSSMYSVHYKSPTWTDRSDLVNFLTKLSDTSMYSGLSNINDFKQADYIWYTGISGCTNLSQVIKYCAAEAYAQSTDGIVGNFNNSFYVFDNNGRLSIVPWNMDTAFGAVVGNVFPGSPYGSTSYLFKRILSNFYTRNLYIQTLSNLSGYITNNFNTFKSSVTGILGQTTFNTNYNLSYLSEQYPFGVGNTLKGTFNLDTWKNVVFGDLVNLYGKASAPILSTSISGNNLIIRWTPVSGKIELDYTNPNLEFLPEKPLGSTLSTYRLEYTYGAMDDPLSSWDLINQTPTLTNGLYTTTIDLNNYSQPIRLKVTSSGTFSSHPGYQYNGLYSTESAPIIVPIPAAPSNLAVSSVSDSVIILTWTDSSNNETGFKLERKTGLNGSWSEIATLSANTITYTNTGLTNDTTYYYRIRSYSAAGNSSYSNEISAITQTLSVPYVPTMKIRITEAMSSSDLNYGLSSAPDWFEITNFDTSGVSITGWKMDDSNIVNPVSLIPSGWTVLNTGESAIFIETTDPSTAIPAFRSAWNMSSNIKIGYYNGVDVSLSSAGDAVRLFVPSGSSSSSWVYLTGVSFGAAIKNRSFYWEYDSSGSSITSSGQSLVDYKGAYQGSYSNVYATGSPGIYNTGTCTSPLDLSMAYSCLDLRTISNTLDPWNPEHCNSDKAHTAILPKNVYLSPQILAPPANATGVLCDNDYPVSMSNRIKITIPDDSIFSGTYYFDYIIDGFPTSTEYQLMSNWRFDSFNSIHNLSPYNHPQSTLNGEILVSLYNIDANYGDNPFLDYPGYIEIKGTGFQTKDETNDQSIQPDVQEVFAFPAQLIFTAVQPPSTVTGYPGTAFEKPYVNGTGHRLVVGISLPIRWRHSYRNWVLVDKKSHTIENSISNYVTNLSTSQGSLVTNNNITINYVTNPIDINAGNASDTNMICTGIPNLGFAFKTSASNLGYDRGFGISISPTPPYQSTVQGIGPLQIFDRYQQWDESIGGLGGPYVDERPLFDSKTPVKANIEFVYSCRSGIPCNIADTPISVSTTTGLFEYDCWSSNYLGTDYLCENDSINAQVFPPDSVWISNNITSTDIIYSGFNLKNVDSTYTYRTLPIEFTGTNLQHNTVVKIYDFDPSTNSSNILIKSMNGSSGYPNHIRSVLQSRLFVYDIKTLNSNPSNLPPIIETRRSNKWDLYWNIDTSTNTAKVYVIPDIENLTVPEILITGAGSSDINGLYIFNGGYMSGYGHGNLFIRRVNNVSYRIALSTTGNNEPYRWRIQKYVDNKWVNFYVETGVYQNMITYTDSSRVGTVNTGWTSNAWCYSGLNPPPSSITYYYK